MEDAKSVLSEYYNFGEEIARWNVVRRSGLVWLICIHSPFFVRRWEGGRLELLCATLFDLKMLARVGVFIILFMESRWKLGKEGSGWEIEIRIWGKIANSCPSTGIYCEIEKYVPTVRFLAQQGKHINKIFMHKGWSHEMNNFLNIFIFKSVLSV